MARITSIVVTVALATIFMYPTTGRESQQNRYLLVQISETMKGKGRQLGDWVSNKTDGWIAHPNTLENRVLNAAGSLGSAIKNTALNAFDKVAESSVPLPNIPAPNTGSLGK